MDKDELGAVRHAMTAKELDELYKRLENFIADCTRSEVDANRDALNKVQSMIHKKMKLTNKKVVTAGGNPGIKERKNDYKKVRVVEFPSN